MPEETAIPELPESLRNGVYANFFSTSVGENEAIIDFGSILPRPGSDPSSQTVPVRNVIVARVIVSRAGARKLCDLLDGLLKKS